MKKFFLLITLTALILVLVGCASPSETSKISETITRETPIATATHMSVEHTEKTAEKFIIHSDNPQKTDDVKKLLNDLPEAFTAHIHCVFLSSEEPTSVPNDWCGECRRLEIVYDENELDINTVVKTIALNYWYLNNLEESWTWDAFADEGCFAKTEKEDFIESCTRFILGEDPLFEVCAPLHYSTLKSYFIG